VPICLWANLVPFYSPGPSEYNTSWMTKYQYLKDLGWGIAPIFFGQQEPGVASQHILTTKQGYTRCTSSHKAC